MYFLLFLPHVIVQLKYKTYIIFNIVRPKKKLYMLVLGLRYGGQRNLKRTYCQVSPATQLPWVSKDITSLTTWEAWEKLPSGFGNLRQKREQNVNGFFTLTGENFPLYRWAKNEFVPRCLQVQTNRIRQMLLSFSQRLMFNKLLHLNVFSYVCSFFKCNISNKEFFFVYGYILWWKGYKIY